METITLNNQVNMPILGYGTFQTPLDVTAQNVEKAINAGYRSIDTAQIYGNEAGVGTAITNTSVPRSDLFITTKTQTDGYNRTLQGIDNSLSQLKTDYVDLLLIHWPTTNSLETYRALETALKAGKARAIGLSNFNPNQIDLVLQNSTVKPAIDQIETHLYWQQSKLRPYLAAHQIVHESWAPFGEQYAAEMMSLPVVTALADKYAVTSAQVLLRALTQQKIVVIPKSTNDQHLRENIDSFGFTLTAAELASLAPLDKHQSIKDWPTSMRESNY